jgi:hypothetical protein
MQILEYYNKVTEAKDILIQYRDKNTENLNAHKYIYYFSVRNEALKEEELLLLTVCYLKILERYSEICLNRTLSKPNLPKPDRLYSPIYLMSI